MEILVWSGAWLDLDTLGSFTDLCPKVSPDTRRKGGGTKHKGVIVSKRCGFQILPTKYYNCTDTTVLTLNCRKQSHQKLFKSWASSSPPSQHSKTSCNSGVTCQFNKPIPMIPNHNFSSLTPIINVLAVRGISSICTGTTTSTSTCELEPSRNTTIPQSNKLCANASLRVSRPLWSEVFLSNFRPDANDPLIHFRCVEEGTNTFCQVRKGKSGP